MSVAAKALAALAAAVALAGCSLFDPGSPSSGSTVLKSDFAALAEDLTTTLEAKDEPGFAANFADSTMAQELAQRWYGNLSQVSVATFGTDDEGSLEVTWAVPASQAPAVHKVVPHLAKVDGRAVIMDAMYTDDPPIWYFDDVSVDNSSTVSLIASETVSADQRQAWLKRAAKAVKTVKKAGLGMLAQDWNDRLVVEIPRNTRDFQLLVGIDPKLSGAATECEGGAIRVVVNPASLQLPDEQAEALIVHEAVHAATGSPCEDSGALWASEGLAESVTAKAFKSTRESNLATVTTYLAESGVPAALPVDADFTSAKEVIWAAYALSEVAVDAIFDNLGTEAALDLLAKLTRTPDKVDAATNAEVTGWYRKALEEIAAAK
ncbi:MAG: hypothetical protein LBR32_05545 [Propionibacteriaceae bacterium]|nr:hypothetical protein [Propionibacteriaceae bacterium]